MIKGDFSLKRARLDGNGTETPGFLPGQPTRIYNAALYYAGSQFDMNVSFNRTGSFIVGFFPDAPQNDIYHLGRTIVNAKMSYALDKSLRLFLAGYNLTSKDLVEVSGPPELKSIRRIYRAGTGISFGLNYSLGS